MLPISTDQRFALRPRTMQALSAVGAILCTARAVEKLETPLTADDAIAVCLANVTHLQSITERIQ